jgi:predicted alpha/beta hydrolase family esterase
MVHGRLDMNGPLEAARELSRAWSDAELLVAEDAGHLDSETKVRYVYEAIIRFAGLYGQFSFGRLRFPNRASVLMSRSKRLT